MKPCPHCGNGLADEAITCRGCDEFLAPIEPRRYDVVLVYPGCRGFDVVGTLSDLTGSRASAARKVVFGCRDEPQRVFVSLALADAERAWRILKRTGATAEILEAGG